MPLWLELLLDLAADIRYALRALARHKGFSLTVVAVLALGIGLNAAVFTMLKGMVLTPLAGVDDARALVVMFAETSARRELRVSYPDYTHLRDRNEAFSHLFGSSLLTVNIGRGREARQISAELVTGNYFEGLGIGPGLGRTLLPSDAIAPGGHPVVVLSDSLWRRAFNADAAIVGRTVAINNYPFTVVGVAAPDFRGTILSYDVEAFLPVTMIGELGITGGLPPGTPSSVVLSDPRAQVVFPHGRLRTGATIAAAAAEAGAMWTALTRDRAPTETTTHLRIVPFRESPTGGQNYVIPVVGVLSAMGLLVLLIACANIAGLVLVRGVSRRGEIAVRLALGASRRRIVRLLIAESLVLAIPGALLGVMLARRAVPLLIEYAAWLAAPQRLFLNIGVDGMVVAFAVIVAVASALVFGFLPALQSARVELVSVINEDASPRGAARGRLRANLVVAQVAVSLLLLVGAGLAARTVDAARRADRGYDGRDVVSVDLDVKLNGYDEARGRAFYRALLDRVRGDAGSVESATLALYHPMAFLDTRPQRVAIDGHEPRQGEDLAFLFNVIGTEYFRTLRIPTIAGRVFDERDDEAGAPVAIVNQTFAERFWNSPANALGRRLRSADGTWRTVVGVAADVKYTRINAAPQPYFYLPLWQSYRSTMMLHARGVAPADADAESTVSRSIEPLVSRTRSHVEALDANLPILFARPMEETTRGAFLFYDLTATMLSIFGLAGTALAVMGTYGLVAYVVRQSTREIGIRMALGAPRLSVVRAFVSRGLRLGAIGAAIGLLLALGVGRLLGSLLFGIGPTDFASFAGALAIVCGGVILATLVPAWRAARTDALTALRHH
jgi:predicted permease